MNDLNRPDMVNVFVPAKRLKMMLKDRRPINFGCVFGRLGDVARQHGVKNKKVEGGFIFTAPKERMQLFVEKLHFSVVPFQELK